MNDVLDEKRQGHSLRDSAEIMHHWQEFKTDHGEPGYKPYFQQFLRGRGLTEQSWMSLWGEWHDAMEKDKGLAAKYHTYYANYATKQRTAKQPNVSGDTLGGLSLETYAKISAKSQTGAAVEGLVAGEGLTMAQWHEGQAAWGAKMGNVSPTDPIILQYGQLYQKWSPNHQASMEATTQKALEDAADRAGKGGGMSESLTMDNANKFFSHPDIRVRARGVREMIRIWELNWNDRTDAMRQLTQRAHDEAVKILNHGPSSEHPGLLSFNGNVNDVDIHKWSKMADEEEMHQGTADLVSAPIKDLAGEEFMTSAQNQAARSALQSAINRLEPRAAKVDQLFEAVVDELKKVQLRSLKDDYRETLNDFEELLEDWDFKGPETPTQAAASSASPSSSSASASQPANQALAKKSESDDGILAILKKLPIIGPILKMLGL